MQHLKTKAKALVGFKISYFSALFNVLGGLAQNLVKTRTCLHTSSPVFNEKSIFVYTFGNKSLFQENFQKAFTNASGSDSNKITFELWKRSYQPNAREQIIAKVSVMKRSNKRSFKGL